MLRGYIGKRHSADTGQPAPENVTTAAEPVKTEKTFTQAELEQVVKDRLDRAQRKAQADADKARQDAEAKALAEQGEFKTLAEQRAARIAELEAATEAGKATTKQLERYQASLKKHLDAQRADLPTHIVALLDRLDVADQLEWLAENRAAMTPQTKGDGVGSPANGKRPALPDTSTFKFPKI